MLTIEYFNIIKKRILHTASPISLHTLHFLHSMHCHGSKRTLKVNSLEYCMQVGCPKNEKKYYYWNAFCQNNFSLMWIFYYLIVNQYHNKDKHLPLFPQSLHDNKSSSSPYLFFSGPPLQNPQICLSIALSSAVIFSSFSSSISPSFPSWGSLFLRGCYKIKKW